MKDCPECGGDLPERLWGNLYRCKKCGATFEAGKVIDYDERDPSRRIMRAERKKNSGD